MATLFVDDYPALFRHLLERGIYLAPSQNEAMFLSTAHGDEEIDRTIEERRHIRHLVDRPYAAPDADVRPEAAYRDGLDEREFLVHRRSRRRWSYFCKLDGEAFSSCASPKTYPGPLEAGSHVFQVKARISRETRASQRPTAGRST